MEYTFYLPELYQEYNEDLWEGRIGLCSRTFDQMSLWYSVWRRFYFVQNHLPFHCLHQGRYVFGAVCLSLSRIAKTLPTRFPKHLEGCRMGHSKLHEILEWIGVPGQIYKFIFIFSKAVRYRSLCSTMP